MDEEGRAIHLLNTTMLSHETLRAEFDALAQELNQLKESIAAATAAATVSPGHTPYAPLSSAPAPLGMPHMSNQLTVHTTDSLPRLTLTGEQSIKNPAHIDKVESYIKRSHGPPITLAQVAEPKVIDVMMSMFRTRRSVIVKKVCDDPFTADAEEIPLWLEWPLIKILQAWRPCQAEDSTAIQALTLREQLVGVEVECDFTKSWEVSLMLAELSEKVLQIIYPRINRHR